MQQTLAEWRSQDPLHPHSAYEERITQADRQNVFMRPQIMKSFAQFVKKSVDCAFHAANGLARGLVLLADHMAAFAHHQIAGERNHVSGKIDQPNTTQSNWVIGNAA